MVQYFFVVIVPVPRHSMSNIGGCRSGSSNAALSARAPSLENEYGPSLQSWERRVKRLLRSCRLKLQPRASVRAAPLTTSLPISLPHLPDKSYRGIKRVPSRADSTGLFKGVNYAESLDTFSNLA
eukprot:6176551-Pleurochrysis_carterae.AAC.4